MAIKILGNEPTIIIGALTRVVEAVFPTAVILGYIHWDGAQVAQAVLFTGLVMAFVQVWLTRSQVYPELQVNALIKTAVKEPSNTTVAQVKEIQAAKEQAD